MTHPPSLPKEATHPPSSIEEAIHPPSLTEEATSPPSLPEEATYPPSLPEEAIETVDFSQSGEKNIPLFKGIESQKKLNWGLGGDGLDINHSLGSLVSCSTATIV